MSAEPNAAIIDLIPGRARDLGGFVVRRVLPIGHRQSVGPFIFFDHMGPVTLPVGTGMDVRPHPHIGLATVTYLFTGRIQHRDSLGSVQLIEPGAVNWMTAGRGIVHSERSTAEDREAGVQLHGIQSWVALPIEDEECAPAFVHHPAATLPQLSIEQAHITVIAGSAYGLISPVVTASPTLYLDLNIARPCRLRLPNDYPERAVYPVDANIAINGTAVEAGNLAVLAAGMDIDLETTGPARVMVIGGEPLPTARTIWWNFVSSRPERIEQAKLDWKTDRFAHVPGESEFIPLPE